MRKLILIVVLFFIWLGYMLWSSTGRVTNNTHFAPDNEKSISIEIFGDKGYQGNLVGIQPFMNATDYATPERFYSKLNTYLAKAKEQGLLNTKSVVVFPEHIGTWLVATGEKKSVFSIGKADKAMHIVVASNIFSFLQSYLWAEAKDKARAALFLMKANQMAGIYSQVFKRLAKEYRVTIVAGSIFLPTPKVLDNQIKVEGNKLFNASFVFLPDGSISPSVVLKEFPISEELKFCQPGNNNIPAFDTPMGKLAVVICADSWYPEIYNQLAKDKVEVMVIPSYSSPTGLWHTPWLGYNGAEAPPDIDKDDIGKITEEDAWLKYSLGSRALHSPIKLGINVFLRGNIWDLGDDGHTIAIKNDTLYTSPFYDGPQISTIYK